MSKPKIYISSTYFDLQEHRAALAQALEKTECFDVVKMENYGTRSEKPASKCMNDVADSEFYILLLGNRYGYIPEDQPYSVTNLEYKQAIGDTDMSCVAGVPNYSKCVLPFLMNENYQLPEPIMQQMAAEEKRDGEELTKKKKQYLDELKKRIKSDFVIDTSFTSPGDLVQKVLGALIHEMARRNYGTLINKILIPEEVVYRCNRERVRNEFLYRNFYSTDFYRVFIVHGEKPELPMIFSNNISEYELNATDTSFVLNLEDYLSNLPEKFIDDLIRDLYYHTFQKWPETYPYTLTDLLNKIVNDTDLTTVVAKFDVPFISWKGKYKTRLALFFDKIHQANEAVKTAKNFFILINVKYDSAKEMVKHKHVSFTPLDKLTCLRTSHVEQWVRTYLILNTDKTIAGRNRVETLAQSIINRYFAGVDDKNGFTMEEAIPKLLRIVDDFNNNREPFDNYNKPFWQ
jgi:hypothetical protein